VKNNISKIIKIYMIDFSDFLSLRKDIG